MDPTEVTVTIRYRALEGRAEPARRELEALIANVLREEPDCRGITMLVGETDPAHILLVERWTDSAAYLGPHLQTPHLVAFRQRAPELIAGPPEISFWRRAASD